MIVAIISKLIVIAGRTHSSSTDKQTNLRVLSNYLVLLTNVSKNTNLTCTTHHFQTDIDQYY